MRSDRVTLLVGVGAALTLTGATQIRAQTVLDTIPFVGCGGKGEADDYAPPDGEPERLRVKASVRGQLSNYKGSQTTEILAPRGWRCWFKSGPWGTVLYVFPASATLEQVRDSSYLGSAVILEELTASTSGRYEVAPVAARYFSKSLAEFIAGVRRERFVPDSELSPKPYPLDSVAHPDRWSVVFKTPAARRGFGTELTFAPSESSIRGFVNVSDEGDGPDMLMLRVRLDSASAGLESALLARNYFCTHQPWPCDGPNPQLSTQSFPHF
jgi:hypothetical protein